MKRYSSYKETNIIWLKTIPCNWTRNKIKFTTYVKGRVGWHGLRSDEFATEGPLLVTGTEFIDGKVKWDNCYHFSEERYLEDPFIQLKENDLLITKDGTIGKVALVKSLPSKASLNSGILLLRPTSEVYITDFMYWILSSKIFTDFIDFTKTGSTIQHLYQEVFENFKFPVPSLNEQKIIVKYLNTAIQKIDKLISQKQKLIDLLKEERVTVINQAVTKGINPDAEMKDSGIEWLGTIPIHWKINKLKFLIKGKLTNGIFKKREYFGDGTKIINVIDLYNNNLIINLEKLEKVQLTLKELHIYNALVDDIFFVRSSLKLEGIATSSLIDNTDEPLVYECHVIKITPDKTKINPIFLVNFLNCVTTKDRLISLSQTTTMTTISQEKIASLETIFPTLTFGVK